MLILALDTSGPSAGLALLREQSLLYEATVVNKLTHSVNLMPMVEEAFMRSGQAMDQVGLFAAVAGPGSFTGVRIAVSAVKAMAMAQDKPCIAINALEALALGLLEEQRLICPIRDARAGQVYGAAFCGGQRLMPDVVLKLPEYLARIAVLGQSPLFVGDGVPPLKDAIVEALGSQASFAPAHLNQLKAGAAAQIAWQQRHLAGHPDDLRALYLRRPQAERERLSRLG